MNKRHSVEAETILTEHGVFRKNDHLVLANGLHSREYVAKDNVFPHPASVSRLCEMLAHAFVLDGVEVIVGPAIGGVLLAQWTAYHLNNLRPNKRPLVLGVYAEHEEEVLLRNPEHPIVTAYGMKGRLLRNEILLLKKQSFVLNRGYAQHVAGRKVGVVEDVLTTGGSALETIKAVRNVGGFVVAVGAFCNRGGVKRSDLGDVPQLHSLINMNIQTWTPEECLISGPCSEQVPINTEVGKGKQFLEAQRAA